MKKGESYCTVTPHPNFPDIGIKRYHYSYLRAYQASKEIRENNENIHVMLIPKNKMYFVGTKEEYKLLPQSLRTEKRGDKYFVWGE